MSKKAVKTNEKCLKNNRTTLKITHSFAYCLKIKRCIAKPCLPGRFVGLRLGFDVPEQIVPVRRWPYRLTKMRGCILEKCWDET